ncbi:MAG: hypothetical protein AAB401_11575 [Acidobacteriota bacterium]
MNQAVTVEQLAGRVGLLEREAETIRHELDEIRSKPFLNGQAAVFADQRMVKEAFAEFVAAEGIDVQPVGIEKLREMMKQSGLSELRMSDELIAMRDE